MSATEASGELSMELETLLQRSYRFALSLTHDAAGAEDLVQEACLAVLKAKGPWNRNYLFAAVRTRFYDRIRREKIARMEPLAADPEEPTRNGAESWSLPLPVAANGCLDGALARLRPVERATLYLSAVEGHTAQEIADLLERPRGTILSIMHRAKLKLRRLLEPEGRES